MHMNSSDPREHQPLAGLAVALIRRGLPADYAERAAMELADHHRDLVSELRATGLSESQAADEALCRLGDARALVKKTVREYQRRYWCGRWPLLTFLFGPISLMLLAWVATGLLVFGISWPLLKFGIVGPHEPDGIVSMGERVVASMVVAWFLFAVPAMVVLALARLARRAALSWPWIGLAACVLALSVGMIKSGFPDPALHHTKFDGKELPADMSVLTIGVPVFVSASMTTTIPQILWNWFTRDLKQAVQFLLPLIVAAGVLLRERQLSLRAQRLAVDGC